MNAVGKAPCDTNMVHAAPSPASDAGASKPWVLAATILGSSMAFIDGTVVNVALPTLQRELKASGADALWVVESYALFLAALILVGGALGDRLGRKRVFTAGIALFTVASAACGLAPTAGVLIAARAVQGIGGALLVPGSLAIISASFSAKDRGAAIGTWSGATTVTSALGPVSGGWLVQNVSWRAVFFLNIPLAVIAIGITLLHVPESRDPNATGRLDYPGAMLATVGLGGVVFGLIEWGALGFGQPPVLIGLVVGVAALAGFVIVEMQTAHPMMPLTLFQSRTFAGTNLLTLLLYGGLGGALYFLPFNLQQVQGYSATAAGASLLPFTVIMFGLSRWAGGLNERFGARLPLVVGPSIAAAGFVLFSLPGTGGTYWTTYFPAVVVLALGMAITVAPLTTAVMGSVGQSQAGVASGVNNAVSRASGLLAIAVLGIVVAAFFNGNLDSSIASMHLPSAATHALDVQRGRLGAAQAPASLDPATRAALTNHIHDAFIGGFRVAMLAGAALALVSAVSAAVLIEGKPRKPAREGAATTPAPAPGGRSSRVPTAPRSA